MELPFFGWIDNLPDVIQPGVMGALKGLATAAINSKVDFSVDLQWGEGGYDNVKMLQARAPSQPPILAHPVTGEPHCSATSTLTPRSCARTGSLSTALNG